MSVAKKIAEEVRKIMRTAAYFAVVFIIMMVMKTLNLKDYNIEFSGMSQAIIGALIMAKVIVLMEMISFGSWVNRQPAIVDVIVRTLVYSVGVAIVVILEKAFEARHKVDGYGNAIVYVFGNRDIYHVWATTIGASAAIFVYNAFSIVQMKLGKKGMSRLLFSTSMNQIKNSAPAA